MGALNRNFVIIIFDLVVKVKISIRIGVCIRIAFDDDINIIDVNSVFDRDRAVVKFNNQTRAALHRRKFIVITDDPNRTAVEIANDIVAAGIKITAD